MQKFRVIGCGIGFLILAGISCWATEKSLHLLLPAGWPEILVWGVTIAFFIVASFGTKLIADSVVSSDFVENRIAKFWGGILLVIFFWLIMSMPTNTHTFFYNDKIGSTITEDIETTNKYLTQIIEKGTASTLTLDQRGKEMKDSVEAQRTHIVAQFYGKEPPYKRGNGERIGEHLRIINKILNSSIQQILPFGSQDPAILNRYQIEINKALANALKTHTISSTSVEQAKDMRDRLSALKDSIQDQLSTSTLSEDVIRQCETELHKGYSVINNNKVFIHFDKDSNDEEIYTDAEGETRTERMASVLEVFFVDFIGGKYPASFWYYVLLSILIDIAAFIFFDLAFMNKKEY